MIELDDEIVCAVVPEDAARYRVLLARMIDQAVQDINGSPLVTSPRERKAVMEDAYNWVFNGGFSQVMSFENVCLILGLHPEWSRRRLLEEHPKIRALHGQRSNLLMRAA
jgi:hypothetical protein